MRRETEEWVKIAVEDFKSAEYLFEKSLFRMVCYHAQQTVEKVLKALLTEHEVNFARTHNILDLSNAVKELGYETKLTDEDAIFLNSIYRSRYPSDLGLLPSGEPTEKDAEKALNMAKVMLDWMKSIKCLG